MHHLLQQLRRRTDRRPALALLATLLAAAGADATAQERESVGRVTYTLDSSTLPSIQGRSLEHSASRVELVRWAMVGGGAWGLALGASREGLNPPQPEIGVRWRSALDNNQRLDLSAWRRFNTDGVATDATGLAPAVLSTRIELQFTAPRRPAVFGEGGALGMQLSADSRLSMRIRSGGPLIYYRMRF